MKKRPLFLDEIDRSCPISQASMMKALMDAKLPKRSWLRRMWWRLTGRGPRYYVNGKECRHEESN
jgi:hypothetical protein